MSGPVSYPRPAGIPAVADAFIEQLSVANASPETLQKQCQHLKTLYKLANLPSDTGEEPETWIAQVIALLQDAWPSPAKPHIAVNLDGSGHWSANFHQTVKCLSASIEPEKHPGGTVEVHFPGKEARAATEDEAQADQLFLDAFAAQLSKLLDDRHARQQARVTYHQQRDLLHSLPLGVIYRSAKTGEITKANPEAGRLLGVSADELEGSDMESLNISVVAESGDPLPPEQRPSSIALRESRPVYGCLLGIYYPADQSYKYVLVDAIPQYDNGAQEPYQVYASFREVTEFRQAQTDLAMSQQALEESPEGIVLTDLQCRITYVNQALVTLWGYDKKDEILGMTRQDLLPPDEVAKAYYDRGLALKRKESMEDEFVAKRKDGSTFIAKVLGSVLRDQNGDPIAYMGFVRDITEERTTAQNLQLSESRFRDMAFSSGDLVWELDRIGRYTFAAGNVNHFLGYEAEELIGECWYDFMPEREGDRIALVYQQAIVDEQSLTELESERITRSGHHITVQTSAVPVKDHNGQVTGYRGVDKDITANKQTEERLNLLGHAVEQNPVAVMIAKPDGTITFVNQAFEHVTGYTLADIQNTTIFGLHTPYMAGHTVQQVWKTVTAGKQWQGEFQNQRKDGTFYWEDVILAPILDTNGRITHYIGVKQEVTERKQAEQTIEKEAQLRKLLNQLSGDFINVTPEALSNTIQYSLAAVAKLVVADRAYIFDYDFDNEVAHNTYEWCNDGIEPQIEQLQDIPFSEVPLWVETHKKGESIHIPDVSDLPKGSLRDILEMQDIKSLLTLPLMNGEHCVGFVGFDAVKQYHYYTQQEKEVLEVYGRMIVNAYQKANMERRVTAAKEEAEWNNQLKATFLANLSHEIRTPLNTILGFTQLLEQEAVPARDWSHCIQQIKVSEHRLTRNIDNLVDMAAIESGHLTVQPQPVDLIAVLRERVSEFRAWAAEKGLALELDEPVPEALRNFWTDHTKLESVLNKLLDNALEHTDSGSIQVGASIDDGYCLLYVKDTGHGISEQEQVTVFHQFQQSVTSGEEVAENAGLGLPIAKAKAEMLGGHMWLDSAAGEGTTCYVSLPLSPRPEEQSALGKEPKEPTASGKATEKATLDVLVAEDDEMSYMVLKRLLEKYDARVSRAANGREAVEQVRQRPELDLVMMDLRMPVLSGLEATQQIRDFNTEVIIIAQTAYAVEGDRNQTIKAGCNEYLTKPVKADMLATKLATFFAVG